MAAVEATAQALNDVKLTTMKELKGTERRDVLITTEKKYQAQWTADGVFNATAPTLDEIPSQSVSLTELHEKNPKFYGVMAYPYMNGTLHAGHTFTVSKLEFAAGWSRLVGKRVLFPMGYHCTGMAVKAAADKLVNEVNMFGPMFEGYTEDAESAPVKPAGGPAPATAKEDVTKFASKKGKTAAKTVKMKYQFQIMRALGIPLDEIYKFADAQHWFQFFPPLVKRDLTNLGARIDWRREMVTTDANPYYDSFVRWQMNRLKEIGKIKFGKRYTIYSPKDGQPCMDHDRSEGEAVGPQEYTAMKMKVLEWAPEAKAVVQAKIPEFASVFFVAATLRPETMYGQTCCFVGPSLTYGIFKVSDDVYYFCTDRAARNMAFQGIFQKTGVCDKVVEVQGSQCIGTLVHAPLSVHKDGVRILPMETVLATKGTGVVTCVPSDSPDDYITIADLVKKSDYYKIKKEWASLEMVSVLKTPSYGEFTAEFLVKQLKITSPKDTKQLEQAKELAYKEGFYQGIVNFGEFKGETVEVAKPKIRKILLDSGEGFAYAEPERRVVSRSADECCVALMDQWYLDYGEENWKNTALDWVANVEGKGMETWSNETKNGFEGVLNWLNQWACARTYGHGSKLPWDPQFMVESLSDSTIYMSYFTIAHYLHSDKFGRSLGIGKITADQMTDEVWDYVFARRELSDEVLSNTKISRSVLDQMRREFEYWYPVDVNISGKDLIPNHLTFFIYVHLAIWEKQIQFWPKGVRANGHLLLNGEKMAKSTGNFLTLDDLVKKYGADASRIAMADAGDGVADANFEEDVADKSILKLYNLREWCEEQVREADNLRTGSADLFFDKIFVDEMNTLIEECGMQYEATNYKLALKAAFYSFTTARDWYRETSIAAGIPMHRDVIMMYIEYQALILSVIAPHWCEYIWLEVLKKPTTIQNARYPKVPAPDISLAAAREYVRATSSAITSAEAAQHKKKAKGKSIAFDPKKPKKVTIYVASKFPDWQGQYVDLLGQMWDDQKKTIDEEALLTQLKKTAGKDTKKVMPFVQNLKKRLLSGEPAGVVLQRKLDFDEVDALKQMTASLKRAANLQELDVVLVDDNGKDGIVAGSGRQISDLAPQAGSALPGAPTFDFENIES